MVKKFISVVFVFLTTLVMFATCESPVSSPTGIYTPADGMPGGGKLGDNQGVPDPSYTGYRFDASSFATMPSVAVWNSLGHQHAFPDLFHFANGNKVVTRKDWEARQEEISRILQYYEYGIMPPLTEEEGVYIEFSNSGAADTHFRVTYRGNPVPYEFDIPTSLPGTQTDADRGRLGVSFVASSPSTVNWSGGTGSFVSNGFFAQEIDASGPVRDLFNYDITRPDSPSANMYTMPGGGVSSLQAWKASISTEMVKLTRKLKKPSEAGMTPTNWPFKVIPVPEKRLRWLPPSPRVEKVRESVMSLLVQPVPEVPLLSVSFHLRAIRRPVFLQTLYQ
jgi:hypothetical protein